MHLGFSQFILSLYFSKKNFLKLDLKIPLESAFCISTGNEFQIAGAVVRKLLGFLELIGGSFRFFGLFVEHMTIKYTPVLVNSLDFDPSPTDGHVHEMRCCD